MTARRTLGPLALAALLVGCSAGDGGLSGTAGDPAVDAASAPAAPSDPGVDAALDAPGPGPTDAEGATPAGYAATDGDASVGAGPPAGQGPAPAGEPVQSGTLTAGDHDDHLNPGRYRAYASRYLQAAGAGWDLPSIDLTRRVTIAVADAAGAPLAGARVRALSADVIFAELRSGADGLAHLYPDVDALPASFEVTVADRPGDVRERRAVELEALGAARRVDVALPSVGAAPTALDLALVIDTTGSMGDELRYLQAELGSIVGRLAGPGLDVRVALVAYRDAGDEYVVRARDFTHDLERARAELAAERADGGGDYPEAMDRALEAALGLDWRADATKIALLVADAPPHPERARATFDAALEARRRMIHVVPVAASGVAAEAQYLMRAAAAVTQARYLFLTDDSGVGLPHEAPDVACYLVTRLDGLIVRTVRSLVAGVRVEPDEGEILRRVGHYDAGRCLDAGQ